MHGVMGMDLRVLCMLSVVRPASCLVRVELVRRIVFV